MFCFKKKKKLTAVEARILAHIGLQKKQAEQESWTLNHILNQATAGRLNCKLSYDYCNEQTQAMLKTLGYYIEETTMQEYNNSFMQAANGSFVSNPAIVEIKCYKVSWL